ncbi:MAG: RsmB/NOP family class I SAM-dependent RNA methyltransferase [Lachnospiraceae bacterium]|nr:RsmB/NOP family class I SAM-dependent RNA methyltransferase [Lachnospiraceae bacterium]
MKNDFFDTATLPAKFLERMKSQLGGTYEAFLSSYEKPFRRAFRVNTSVTGDDELLHLLGGAEVVLPVPFARHCYYYPDDLPLGKSPLHEAGLYYIQEPSAMSVGETVSAAPGEIILDLCAAPGGKTASIAADMAGRGVLFSNEIHPARAKILSQNVERLGLKNCIVTNATPSDLAGRFPAFFDKVLVDAPCSGEGMFRKEPDAIACWSEENIAMCAARQRDILRSADILLAPGGELIYSTCTFAPVENERQIAGFLNEHPGYSLVSMEHLYPHKVDGEGHFVAKLRKDGTLCRRSFPTKPARIKKELLTVWENFKKDVLIDPDFDSGGEMLCYGDNLYLCPAAVDLSGIKCLRPGLHLGAASGGRFAPGHALSHCLSAADVSRAIDLSSDDAARYISGLTLPCSTDLAGIVLVTVGGHGLSWGKATRGTLKNHYPKGLRKG